MHRFAGRNVLRLGTFSTISTPQVLTGAQTLSTWKRRSLITTLRNANFQIARFQEGMNIWFLTFVRTMLSIREQGE
jgi:hypothetical protein